MLKITFRSRGAALFVSVLLTLSLSIIALATMSKLSELSHTRVGDMEERRLQIYAFSAMNIVNGELRQLLDSTLDFADFYSVGAGMGVNENINNRGFKYYPLDINKGGDETRFAYRAIARKLTTNSDALFYGIGSKFNLQKDACYDIMVDVVEVTYVGTGTNNKIENEESTNDLQQQSGSNSNSDQQERYVLGKMKTVGLMSCFTKGEINHTGI